MPQKLTRHLLVFFFLLPFAGRCGDFEDRYGIGVVHVEPYNYFSLAFWATPHDVMPVEQVYFYRDSLQDHLHYEFATSGKDTAPPWFSPLLFSIRPNMKRIDFYCIERNEDWCRVVVNSATGETKWIETGVDVRLLSWTQFFKNVACIQPSTSELLYEKPDARSRNEPIAGENAKPEIKVLKVEGEWMNIEVISYDSGHRETARKSGWIRWRDDKDMRIPWRLTGC